MTRAYIKAAARELYEESGISDASLYPVCDYHGYDARGSADGVVFLADVRSIGQLPESEMKEVRLFTELPDNLTYPDVTPKLMREALEMYQMLPSTLRHSLRRRGVKAMIPMR